MYTCALSFHVVRLGRWAPRTNALRLAVAKAGMETAYALAFVCILLGVSTFDALHGFETTFPPAAVSVWVDGNLCACVIVMWRCVEHGVVLCVALQCGVVVHSAA